MTISLDGAPAVTDLATSTSPLDGLDTELAAQSPPTPGPAGVESDMLVSGTENVAGYPGTPELVDANLLDLLSMDLPDAAAATFAPPPADQPTLESVIGRDDRTQIVNTATYPWSAHASLLIEMADGSFAIGTGFFIGPHTVVTAGHCVFVQGAASDPRRGWVRSVTVMPGRNGNLLPFGSVKVGAAGIRSVSGWTGNGDPNWDAGALILPSNLGNQTGTLGFANFSTQTLNSTVANITGYPGDKPNGTQWYHSRALSSVSAQRIHYEVDTFGGQSGSAVYRLLNGQRHAFGIHTNGVFPGVPTNSGVRITQPLFDRLKAWTV